MSKTLFVQNGNHITLSDAHTTKAFDNLPVATYTVKFDERSHQFFLETIDPFTLPSKIYGSNPRHAERVLNTFANRQGSTGVMLNGIKGAGKTLLAKQISVLGAAQGYPTIVINRDWHGDEFNTFIQSIHTPTIIVFDEFEKIYDWNTQKKILTLFDGVFNSRKLFIVTTNNDREVSEFMRNRPGRIFYNFIYDTLGQDFIEEYLLDRLDDKSQIPGILKYTQIFSFFNFDMLAAAVEEMNRYGETLAQVLEVLNIQPENKYDDNYTVELVLNGDAVVIDNSMRGFQPGSFEYTLYTDDDMPEAIKKRPPFADLTRRVATQDNDGYDSILFGPPNIDRFEQDKDLFVYKTSRNGVDAELHVRRNKRAAEWKYDYNAL